MNLPPALQAILDEFPKNSERWIYGYVDSPILAPRNYPAEKVHAAIFRAWEEAVKASAKIAVHRRQGTPEEIANEILSLIPKGDTP